MQSRSSDCGFSFLFDPSVSARKCRFRLWSFPQIENCAPLPVANTAQRKRLGNRKSEEGISFSPSPSGLFIYLMSTSPSRLSSRQLLGQRWVTHVASPRLLKGCGHGGVTVQKSLSICAKGLIHQRHGGILAAACGLYPTGAARRSRGVTDDEGETIPALSRLLLNM